MKQIAVNGFGRIGRCFVRAFLQDKQAQKNMKIAVINIGPARPDFVASMFKYDTLMGTFAADIQFQENTLIVDSYPIPIIAESDVTKLPWQQYDIDWVVDCTGKFTNRADAQKHIDQGAKKVLISAPAHDEDVAIIPGVNDADFNPSKHAIVSLGSCTTNAFIPTLKVLHDALQVIQGFMKTVHAYTNSQVLLDVEAKDLRSSRAAALNIIPGTTGASKMLAKIMPELADVITGMAVRVPVGKVSLLDLNVTVAKKASMQEVNNLFTHASKGAFKGIIDLTNEPLVSSDFSGNPHSVVIDSLLTQAIGNQINVFGWYDNEWGYSMRLKDFLKNL